MKERKRYSEGIIIQRDNYTCIKEWKGVPSGGIPL
jgi:hypothetical protein